MVSLRRRRLLGLCSGAKSVPVDLTVSSENGSTAENANKSAKLVTVHPMPPFSSIHHKLINNSEASLVSSNVSASSSSKEDTSQYFPGKQIKRRKKHRRKLYEDQEPCIMRGVYLKNMKWQAAIKVDKKQIHLGTVGSQEEAARLYDRAAFMCGREPNFQLSEKEKQELSRYNWEEFLAITRSTITTKRHHRRIGGAPRRKRRGTRLQVSDGEQGGGSGEVSSMSDNEDETSAY
ncbi:ethylene-responsive transcription factor-like protein isoform X1 [Iris pallida]|uniref:Ethylene-responsive transcription factor-like protein isoform X1 n=1 Tax=Iris pallida TaxID=29817 RepID=A0AAX6IJC4_IRIPA|nr:ethylene-responsive transcription factor-like protein isoform X1 [Iris pallida]